MLSPSSGESRVHMYMADVPELTLSTLSELSKVLQDVYERLSTAAADGDADELRAILRIYLRMDEAQQRNTGSGITNSPWSQTSSTVFTNPGL